MKLAASCWFLNERQVIKNYSVSVFVETQRIAFCVRRDAERQRKVIQGNLETL